MVFSEPIVCEGKLGQRPLAAELHFGQSKMSVAASQLRAVCRDNVLSISRPMPGSCY